MQYKISILMPIYNAEKTLQECLDSIGKQTLKDWQLIMVDDASTDGSREIAQTFALQYEGRVVWIPLEQNGGPGNARNIAMECAEGEYIGFVDADDVITPHMYERLYQEAKDSELRTGHPCDVVDTGYYDQKNDTAILFTADDLTGKLDARKRSVLIASGGYNCTKIFRRAFLEQEGVHFRPEYVLEDMDFLIEVFAKASYVGNVKQILYLYRDTETSLSKTVEMEKYYHSTTTAMDAIYEKVSGVQNYVGIRDAVEYAILQLYSYSVNVVLMEWKAALQDGTMPVAIQMAKQDDCVKKLVELQQKRQRYVSGGYDTIYVRNKISAEDIRVMQMNDEDPMQFLPLLAEAR